MRKPKSVTTIKYRVKLSDQNGKAYLTPGIGARTLAAGGVKVDVLYQKGEQVDVVSANGDMTDTQIDFSTHCAANGRKNKEMPLC